CRGLIMCSAVAQHYSEQDVLQELSPIQRLTLRISDRLLLADRTLYLLVNISRRIPGKLPSPEVLETIAMNHLRDPGYKNDMEHFAQIAGWPYQQITVPTLIVHGTADKNVPFKHARNLAECVPQAKLVTIPNGGHTALITETELLRKTLVEFLTELP